MQYIIYPDKKKFSFSYKELKALYEEYCSLTDELFMAKIKDIIHFACFVSYVKQLNLDQTLSDVGIVHQLVHLMIEHGPEVSLKEIRSDFKEILRLS